MSSSSDWEAEHSDGREEGEVIVFLSKFQAVFDIGMNDKVELREGIRKKYGIIWEFFPNSGPLPTPPFGNFDHFLPIFLVKLEIFG